MIRLEALIGYLLRCAENVVTACYYTTLGSAQITHRQLAVLVCLDRYGHATQTELAMQIRIDRSTVNEMIPRMVERGLIARDESSSDRRAFEVRLTDAGRATLLKVYPEALAAQEKVLACLPKEYRKIFRHCLELILDSNEHVLLAKSVGNGRAE